MDLRACSLGLDKKTATTTHNVANDEKAGVGSEVEAEVEVEVEEIATVVEIVLDSNKPNYC